MTNERPIRVFPSPVTGTDFATSAYLPKGTALSETNRGTRLFPNFSITHLLLGFIAFAIVSSCLSGAYRGNAVGIGFSVAIASLGFVFFAYGAVYWGSYFLAVPFPNFSTPNSDPSSIQPEVVTDDQVELTEENTQFEQAAEVSESNSKPISEQDENRET